jgi:serine/threonine protein kinase
VTLLIHSLYTFDSSEENLTSDDDLKSFFTEYEIGKTINHPFVVRTFDLYETNLSYNLVMELLEGDSLLSLVNSFGAISPPKAQKIFCQLVSTIDFLHQRGIAHRDLKPENILFDKNEAIRVIDFGLSKKGSLEGMSTRCGTVSYAAPELFVEAPYGKETEIWSLGVILYAMIYGVLPFDHENINTLLQLITQTEPFYSSVAPPEAIDLIKSLLKKNPKDRLTIEQIKGHSWFSFVDWSLYEFSDCDFKKLIETEYVIDALARAKEGKQLKRKQIEVINEIVIREQLMFSVASRQTKKLSLKASRMFRAASIPCVYLDFDHIPIRKNKKSPKPNRIIVPNVTSSRNNQRRTKSIHNYIFLWNSFNLMIVFFIILNMKNLFTFSIRKLI